LRAQGIRPENHDDDADGPKILEGNDPRPLPHTSEDVTTATQILPTRRRER
jgi:hypothetical protein